MHNENLASFLSKHFRTVMGAVGVVLILCIGALIALLFLSIKPEGTYLEINVAPSIATMSINGQNYHNGIYEFEPGSYTMEISADGFMSKTINVQVEKGNTAKVSTYLVNQDEGLEYFENNEADLRILSSIDDPDVIKFLESYNQRISIREQLPIYVQYNKAQDLGISGNVIYMQTVADGSFDSRCGRPFCLLVTGDVIKDGILEDKLAELGYNLDDYEVIYDLNN